MINLPLLGIDFPAIAMTIITSLLIIANFDLPYVDMDSIFGEELWNLGPADLDTVL